MFNKHYLVEHIEHDLIKQLRFILNEFFNLYLNNKECYKIILLLKHKYNINNNTTNEQFQNFISSFLEIIQEITGIKIEYDINDTKFRNAVKLWYQRVSSRIPVSFESIKAGYRNKLQIIIDKSQDLVYLDYLSPIDLATERIRPVLEVQNFIEEDWAKGRIKAMLLPTSFSDIFVRGTYRNQFDEVVTYYRKARPGEAEITGRWVVDVMKDTLANEGPIVFFAEVSGDDSRIIFIPAKKVYMGKDIFDFIDYLDEEIAAGNMTEAHKELFMLSYDKLKRLGYEEAAMALMSFHDRAKDIKGRDYLMEEVDENGNMKESSSLAKTWKRLKGDMAKGFVPRGAGDRKIMFIDANDVTYEIPNPNTGQYEKVDAMLPGGRTVADGTMWTSKIYMDRMNNVSGIRAYVYKTYVRYRDPAESSNYTMIKMLEVTPYNGMRVVRKSSGQIIAEYKNGTWVASNGEQFDSVTTINDEVKQARGIFRDCFIFCVNTSSLALNVQF